MNPIKRILQLVHRQDFPFLLVICFMHLLALGLSIGRFSMLTDDSIQYLTIADNLAEFGIFSQSFAEPIVADIQRTPGYPVFLWLLGRSPIFVVVVQHLLLLLSGHFLYRILRRFFRERSARTTAYLYLIQPYPILFASLILSESLFLFVFLAGLMFWARAVRTPMQAGVKGYLHWGLAGILFGLAALVKPVGLPLVIGIVALTPLFLLRERLKLVMATLALTGGAALCIFPWMARNQSISGEFAFSSMPRMGMLHGRLGGLEAWDKGDPVHEHYWYMRGDSIAGSELGLTALRTYPDAKQTHETEEIHPEVSGITFRYFLSHPGEAIGFQLNMVGRMLMGAGYGWSQKVGGNSLAAVFDAGMQLLFNLAMYLAVLLALLRMAEWNSLMKLALPLFLLVLLVSAAAWADGRYRMIADPLLMVFVAWQIDKWWDKSIGLEK